MGVLKSEDETWPNVPNICAKCEQHPPNSDRPTVWLGSCVQEPGDVGVVRYVWDNGEY